MFLHENVTIFVKKSDVFIRIFNNLGFPVKTVKFSYKNWPIYIIVKSQDKFSTFLGKFYVFQRKSANLYRKI